MGRPLACRTVASDVPKATARHETCGLHQFTNAVIQVVFGQIPQAFDLVVRHDVVPLIRILGELVLDHQQGRDMNPDSLTKVEFRKVGAAQANVERLSMVTSG